MFGGLISFDDVVVSGVIIRRSLEKVLLDADELEDDGLVEILCFCDNLRFFFPERMESGSRERSLVHALDSDHLDEL